MKPIYFLHKFNSSHELYQTKHQVVLKKMVPNKIFWWHDLRFVIAVYYLLLPGIHEAHDCSKFNSKF